ncbi:hypothetical protein [Nocardia sp. NPDC006630]|uniref:LppU/SCO3897 family protein n=1 Tax=Nocardia sp. NPDC006630 TaxID=3157181 RepID=UPI00339EA459
MQVNPTSTRRLWRLVPVVLAVFALALAGCSVVEKGTQAVKDSSKSDTARAKVGDCINVIKGSMIDSKTEPVDCASEKAVYKVAKVFDAKADCAADYTSYEETLNATTTAFLCLAPNFKQASCYHDAPMTGYQYADCASSDASFRVLQRIDGQADENLCSADADNVITLSDPQTTFCLGKPQG